MAFESRGNIPVSFSSYFGVQREAIERYGAIDISLVNDLPLFIDPFLLFNSDDEELQRVHREMVEYIVFLRDEAVRRPVLDRGMLEAWFRFPEVKQTWLGFSMTGNSGRGLGAEFARSLYENLGTVFRDFGEEGLLRSPHIEKLCLINPSVGKDKISDFTTNFAKGFLARYTQEFAERHIPKKHLARVAVPRAEFNYSTRSWANIECTLPMFNGDFVLLTPRRILTRDDTFINRLDMIDGIARIAPSIGNEALRFQLNELLARILADDKAKKAQKRQWVADFVRDHPEIVNYYLKYKEDHEADASAMSEREVQYVQDVFVGNVSAMKEQLASSTLFYEERETSYAVAMRKAVYLKEFIEYNDGYRLLWRNGEPVAKESYIQLMFRLVWEDPHGFDLNREVNNGRGPVDYKVSKGSSDKSLVEFKLARNSKLKQNLKNQVDVYKKANGTDSAITVIVVYTEAEQKKVEKILNELGLQGSPHVVTIDARRDNKPSGSNA